MVPWLLTALWLWSTGQVGLRGIFSSLESEMEKNPLLVDGGQCCSSPLVLYLFLICVGNGKVAVMSLQLVTGRRKQPMVNRRWHLEAHVKQPLELSWIMKDLKRAGAPQILQMRLTSKVYYYYTLLYICICSHNPVSYILKVFRK